MKFVYICYFFGFIVGAIGLFFLQNQFLVADHSFTYDLKEVYVFNVLFSIVLALQLLILSKTPKFTGQIGFLYLVSVVLKAALFCWIFREMLFSENGLSKFEAANLLIPLFLALFFEVIFMTKMLKNN